jgi:hypothetical protein
VLPPQGGAKVLPSQGAAQQAPLASSPVRAWEGAKSDWHSPRHQGGQQPQQQQQQPYDQQHLPVQAAAAAQPYSQPASPPRWQQQQQQPPLPQEAWEPPIEERSLYGNSELMVEQQRLQQLQQQQLQQQQQQQQQRPVQHVHLEQLQEEAELPSINPEMSLYGNSKLVRIQTALRQREALAASGASDGFADPTGADTARPSRSAGEERKDTSLTLSPRALSPRALSTSRVSSASSSSFLETWRPKSATARAIKDKSVQLTIDTTTELDDTAGLERSMRANSQWVGEARADRLASAAAGEGFVEGLNQSPLRESKAWAAGVGMMAFADEEAEASWTRDAATEIQAVRAKGGSGGGVDPAGRWLAGVGSMSVSTRGGLGAVHEGELGAEAAAEAASPRPNGSSLGSPQAWASARAVSGLPSSPSIGAARGGTPAYNPASYSDSNNKPGSTNGSEAGRPGSSRGTRGEADIQRLLTSADLGRWGMPANELSSLSPPAEEVEEDVEEDVPAWDGSHSGRPDTSRGSRAGTSHSERSSSSRSARPSTAANRRSGRNESSQVGSLISPPRKGQSREGTRGGESREGTRGGESRDGR